MTATVVMPGEIDAVISRAMSTGLADHWLAGKLRRPLTATPGTAQWAAYRLGHAGITVTARRILTAIATGRHRKPPPPLARLWTAITHRTRTTAPRETP